jgi:hypothetical protein
MPSRRKPQIDLLLSFLRRLHLWLGGKAHDDAPHRHSKHHQRLEPQEANPEAVEELLLVAKCVAFHVFDKGRIRALEEEEGLQDVECVPVWSAAKMSVSTVHDRLFRELRVAAIRCGGSNRN